MCSLPPYLPLLSLLPSVILSITALCPIHNFLLDSKESWVLKIWCLWTVVLEKTLESPLDCGEIQPVHPKGDQSWVFIGRTDAEAETLILCPPGAKNWLLGKNPDAGKDWRQEEKGMTEDEMVGWHHLPDGHEFEQDPGVGDGQGSLVLLQSIGLQRVRLDWATELTHHESTSPRLCSILLTDVWGSFLALLSLAAFLSCLTEDCLGCILRGPLQPPPRLPVPILSLELGPYHPLQLPSPSWDSSHSFQAVTSKWMASRPILAAWPVTQSQHLHWAQRDALLTLSPLLRLNSRPPSISLLHRLSSLALPPWLQVPSSVPSLPSCLGLQAQSWLLPPTPCHFVYFWTVSPFMMVPHLPCTLLPLPVPWFKPCHLLPEWLW